MFVSFTLTVDFHPILSMEAVAAMPAKSLETLAMVYAIGKLQSPLPRKTMLCEGDMNNPA